MQIKTLMRYTSIRTAEIKSSDTPNAGEDVVTLGLSHIPAVAIRW